MRFTYQVLASRYGGKIDSKMRLTVLAANASDACRQVAGFAGFSRPTKMEVYGPTVEALYGDLDDRLLVIASLKV